MNRIHTPHQAHKASRILVIDDEPDILTNYRRLLQRAGHECLALDETSELERHLADFNPDVVVTDLMMPKDSGMSVLARVRAHNPNLPVMIVTAHGSVQSAVEAIKHHAADFLTKPFQVDELLKKIQEIVSERLIARCETPAGRAETPVQMEKGYEIIGSTEAIRNVLELARKVSRTDVNVLIRGESGTGKELIARWVHRQSPRRDQPFVPIDCSSLPENLLESELFGYCKGAFTGATHDKMGLFQFADKGTLFLDEVGELPLSLQAKLLRVLQERRFRPIGGRELTEVDVRIVSATNLDLEKALADRTLRSDLYYRLDVVTLVMPPLRDRREDIETLARHFLRRFCADNKLAIDAFAPEALAALEAYAWPGNVRELQNAIERAATFAKDTRIEPEDLPPQVQAVRRVAQAVPGSGELFARRDRLVGEFERDYLVELLRASQFNVSRAAQKAGCNRRTLYRMIQRYQLDIDALRGAIQGGNE